jgi:predicted Holliday junction resolvase-like endonuclease
MTDIAFNTLSDTTHDTINTKTGNFDHLMKAVTLHLEEQFNAGRITGTDYATVYLGALQSVLAQAVNFTLNMNKANEEATLLEKQQTKAESEKALLDQKKVTEWAQTKLTSSSGTIAGVMGEQIDLFEQQAKGFKWNADAKYLKTVLDAYAINLSVGKVADTSTLPAVGGHATGTGDLSTSSKAGDYIFKLKPS